MTTKKEDLEFFDMWFKEHEKTMNLDELLMKACSYGSLEYIKKYLDMGADVNGKIDPNELKIDDMSDPYTPCPLYMVLAGDYYDYAEYLISRGANVNFPQGLIVEACLLDCEVFFHQLEANNDSILEMNGTKLLLKYGADINIANIHDETVIDSVVNRSTAVWNVVIDFLLKNGANINQLNSRGKTPLDMIMLNTYNMDKEIKYLKSLGAKTSEELKSENI